MDNKTTKQAEALKSRLQNILDGDAEFQLALNERGEVEDKIKRIEAGIAALEADFADTQKAIDADRLSLADDAENAVAINQRIANAMMKLASTEISIEAMKNSLSPTGDLLRRLEDCEDHVAGRFSELEAMISKELQAEVDKSMQTAFRLCQAFQTAGGELSAEVKLISRQRFNQLSMGHPLNFLPFMEFIMPSAAPPAETRQAPVQQVEPPEPYRTRRHTIGA